MRFRFCTGQSLVELLIALGVAGIFLPALITGLVASRNGKTQEAQRLMAVGLVKEAEEATRNVRESGWVEFATRSGGTAFHPAISGSRWVFLDNAEAVNGFTRQIIMSQVHRDSSGAIVSSGGTNDPSTKRVQITVSWSSPLPSSITADLYLTRYLDNLSRLDTLQSDFSSGVASGTAVVATSGSGNPGDGQVELGAGGQGLWCSPNLSITAALDLPKQGVANAISAIEGRAFTGTGENASGVSFANINIANTNPPTTSILGTFDGYKTNAVFGEQDYAYLATDNNSKEIVIINLTTQPYFEAGYFNAGGNSDANGIYVTGNKGYMTAGNKLRIFDLSSKNNERPQLGSVSLWTGIGTAKQVVVVGNYAYVGVSGSVFGLQVINIGNPASPYVVGFAQLNWFQESKGLFVNSTGTRAYLAFKGNNPFPGGFFIVNTTNKTFFMPTLATYNTSGMDPRGMTVVPGNKAIVVGVEGEEYQVVDISNENNPARCGGLNLNFNINGISSVLESDGDAYSYIITTEADSEFRIIEGGPGGQYSSVGTFESSPVSLSNETALNRFSGSVAEPSQTSLKLQVSVATPGAGLTCSTNSYTYVGPNGNPGGFFTVMGSTVSGAIPFGQVLPLYHNPGKCFRYKAFFSTTDPSQSPVLYDMTVNYSP